MSVARLSAVCTQLDSVDPVSLVRTNTALSIANPILQFCRYRRFSCRRFFWSHRISPSTLQLFRRSQVVESLYCRISGIDHTLGRCAGKGGRQGIPSLSALTFNPAGVDLHIQRCSPRNLGTECQRKAAQDEAKLPPFRGRRSALSDTVGATRGKQRTP